MPKTTKPSPSAEDIMCKELDKLWDQDALEGEDLDRATDLLMQLGGVVEDDAGNVFFTTVPQDSKPTQA